ncbi:hypothetical protein [Psychrilyobacter atlanticus]|uniref:hypothetical protein n=1 Tax=Psychrilyobacter atlanticus TaxID=271091 RepID=UPI00041C9E28|nr:hypothetical protein [Psychrilyobacter atlanticus]
MGQTILISEKQLAKQFLITERQVRSLFKNFKYAPGEYLYKECVKEYIKQIKSKHGDHNLEDQKLKKAKRETQEFNLKILKDEYYPDHIVRGALSDMLIKFKSQLLSASRKIIIEIEQKENPDIKKIVEKHVLKSLEELEKYNPPSNKGDK